MLEDEKLLHYVTKDPIQNLRIRVTLTRISVQRPRPVLNVPFQASSHASETTCRHDS